MYPSKSLIVRKAKYFSDSGGCYGFTWLRSIYKLRSSSIWAVGKVLLVSGSRIIVMFPNNSEPLKTGELM